jgi:hypothetical protein
MKKFFLNILLVFVLQACSRPIYDMPYNVPDDAPPMWKLAWEHGCKTGFSAYGNDFYKTLYKYTQDVEKMRDPMYSKGWTDSYNFCRAFVNRALVGEGFTREPNPTLISTSNLNFKMGNRRNDRDVLGSGYFSPIQENQPFVGLFVNPLHAPGAGSTQWGSSSVIGSDCDWLGRCGDDAPEAWHY